MAPDRVESCLSVVASLMSVMGTFFILCCYLILPRKRHVRHALIINMTIADFINATDNSISGLWVLISNKNLTEGDSCVANGFIGQLSVQAVDCSIFAITIVTMWIITTRKNTTGLSLKAVILICAASWILPVTTSLIALFKGYYRPASTNWCWITNKPIYLRYVLTHGWRFLIIFLVTGIAIYTQIYLRRQMRSMAPFNRMRIHLYTQDPNHDGRAQWLGIGKFSSEDHRESYESDEDEEGRRFSHIAALDARDVPGRVPPPNSAEVPQLTLILPPLTNDIGNLIVIEPKRPSGWKGVLPAALHKKKKPSSRKNSNSVEKTMLLNAYPIFYVLLWIPGLANRIAEAIGHPVYALQILQASTQLIGFANALTFGWNERIGKQLSEKFRGRGFGLGSLSGSGSGSSGRGESVSRGEL